MAPAPFLVLVVVGSLSSRPRQAPATTVKIKPIDIKQTNVQVAARHHATALVWLRMNAPFDRFAAGAEANPEPTDESLTVTRRLGKRPKSNSQNAGEKRRTDVLEEPEPESGQTQESKETNDIGDRGYEHG
jgi:hypothetical protein